MRILFIGDIVGSMGREMIENYIVNIRNEYKPHIIIANGENAAGGRGINEKILKEFFQLGINVITMGNHVWDRADIFDYVDNYKNLIRPANYPEDTPGNTYSIVNFNSHKIAVINLQGRTFLPAIECPFKTADRLIDIISKETTNIFVDFHAEATSEKIAMGWYLDGRVTAIIGTHTHVQTADERILPNGTAYITDVGMVGPYDGVLGMNKDSVIRKFVTQLPQRFEVDKIGVSQFNAVIVDINPLSGKAIHIERVRFTSDSLVI